MKRCFAFLVRLFPAPFRRQFGAQLVEQLELDHARARVHGRLRALAHLAGTVIDLLRSALAERVSPTWIAPLPGLPARRRPRAGLDPERLGRTLRVGARALLRAPAFTWTTVLLLGLGVGSVTTVFTLVDHLFLRPLPYPHAERLIRVNSSQSHPSLRDLAAMASVEAWAAASNDDVDLTGEGQPTRLRQARVTDGFFALFGAHTALGRLLLPEDFADDAAVVLSHETWRTVWGGDPSVVGRTIRVDGAAVRVVGVLAPDFVAPAAILDGDGADLWRPVDPAHPDFESRDWHVLVAAGRLAPGASLAEARQEAAAVALARARAFPRSYIRSDGSLVELPVAALQEATVGTARSGIGLLLATVTALLLVACANVAHLFMARGLGRSSEMALRRALGGGVWTIAAQLGVESLLVSTAGTALGVGVAAAALRAFLTLSPTPLPRAGELTLDARIVAFAAATSTFVALIFGTLPMLRQVARAPGDGMRACARGAGSDRVTPSLRRGLVIAEVALSVILVSGAALLSGSFARLRSEPLGFRVEGVWTIPLRITAPETLEQRRARIERIAAAIRSTPGVRAVTWGLSAPLEHLGGTCCWSRLVRRSEEDTGISVLAHPFGGDWFDVFAPRVLAGRPWTTTEAEASPPPAVLNEPLAIALFGSAPAAVGHDILLRDAWHRVVGVVSEDRHYGLEQKHGPAVYVSMASRASVDDALTLAVRVADSAGDTPRRLRDATWTVEPDLALPLVRPMTDWAARATARSRFDAWLVSSFGVIALLLAAAGLYGTLLYTVTRERRELAIRMSLGARASDVQALVLGRGLTAAGIGLALGGVGAWGSLVVIEDRLVGVRAPGPAPFVVAAIVLLLAALVACWIPARRAGAVDPLAILRQD